MLLLGAGDNAAENALFLAERGFDVTVCGTRGGWRAADPPGRAASKSHPRIALRLSTPLPEALLPDAQGITVGTERFELAAVLLGFEPEPSAFALLDEACPPARLRRRRRQWPLAPLRANGPGRWRAGRQADRAGAAPAGRRRAAATTTTARSSTCRACAFGPTWACSTSNETGPQPIQVDAEVNLGALPVVARDADIGHVLDYRRVRTAIIDECTARAYRPRRSPARQALQSPDGPARRRRCAAED